MLTQLRAEDLLDEQDGLEGRNVDVVEEPAEAPANPLAGHPEGSVDLLTICPAKHHSARLIRLQLYPEVPRFHQLIQGL